MTREWHFITAGSGDARTAYERWCDGDLRVTLPVRGVQHTYVGLLCSPGAWRFLISIGIVQNGTFYLVLNLKNVVPLAGRTYEPDGPLHGTSTERLKRRILIHNPGLSGTLDLMETLNVPTDVVHGSPKRE